MVESKEKVLAMLTLLKNLKAHGSYSLRSMGDMEYDKNYISGGIDVLGTPAKLNDTCSTAGYNVNRLKILSLMMQMQF
jgi:hypothetical protein